MYLGRYGDPKTNERYARLIAEIAAQKQRIQQTAPASSEFGKTTDLTIGELILAYLNFAENYYGKDSREPLGLKLALRSVNTLYGSALANDFGPKSLKAIRQHMISVEYPLAMGAPEMRNSLKPF
ncbi:hypothetical protein Spb1_23980 [Planctopirus ephydatiae]|uniref:Uncharacterized protein n=1 Tax=Planctopirus ephydatiae TaxID=2528019 RepID=A0A518GPK0_9PLAN|nr:hypothetical protein [Planctopirus ephydatiae]QDV30464.1 hypothetical protein Spb1_23980 [Planctopirus ephydatiae]